MNSERSPSHKVQYINETILNTPQPQASSTVQRKGVLSYRFHNKNDLKTKTKKYFDEIPTRDIDAMSEKSNSTRLSSSSSLGLLSLDNMEDFHDYMNSVTKTDSDKKSTDPNVHEKLQIQRVLAQKALERADSKTSTGGLPSYLLKASDTPGKSNISNNTAPFRNESTINLSDLEKSLPKASGIKISDISDKLSFEAKEISARSSSFGNKYQSTQDDEEIIDLRSPSPVRGHSATNDFSSQCQSIYNKILQSDRSIAEICDRSSKMGVHTQPLGSLPLPDIETINISSDSERSWCNRTQDSLIAKLQNELFTPAELAGDQLLAGELSWRKEKDTMPVDFYNNSKKAAAGGGGGERGPLEWSSFSGYIGDEDFSIKSNKDEKLSIGEFFKRRTEEVGTLNLKASPEKKNPPMPLINLTSSSSARFDESLDVSTPRSTCPLREETQALPPTPSAELSRMSTDSIMSVSRIADILSKMEVGDTPSRVMDALLKKSVHRSDGTLKTTCANLPKTASPFDHPPQVTTRADHLQSTSSRFERAQIAASVLEQSESKIDSVPETVPRSDTTRKNESSRTLENRSVATSEQSTLKDSQQPLSKLTDSTRTLTPDSVVDTSSKENAKNARNPPLKPRQSSEFILKDTTNILERDPFDQQIVHSAPPNMVHSAQNEVKYGTADGDWTDAKENGAYTPENNRTLSSISESPSYSCSELEFSEDDNHPDSLETSRTENWLEIDQDVEPRKLCTNIPTKTSLAVTSLTNHWILVKVHVKDALKVATRANIHLFNEDGLLKSHAREQLDLKVTSLVTGKFEIGLRIELTDMATKTQRHIDHRLVFESEEPQLQVSNSPLDFKMNCEGCVTKRSVTLYNCCSVDLPLTFVITQEVEWIYVFAKEMDTEKSEDKPSEVITVTSATIPAGASMKLYIDMQCPHLAELHCSSNKIDLNGLIRVYVAESMKVLQEISLTGSIGLTKIQFKSTSRPLMLTPGQTKVLQVRNSGIVTMELVPKIVDVNESPVRSSCFTVAESSIVLSPGQIGTVSVSFNLREQVLGPVKRVLKLQHHRGPGFVFFLEGITDDKGCRLSPGGSKCSLVTSKTSLVTSKTSLVTSKSPLLSVKSPLVSKSPRASPVSSRHSKDRRSVERKSVSPSPSDRASTRTSSQTGGRSSTNSSDSRTLTYLQDGKLPIESTRTELVWGCVKPGKTSSQEFVLRNRCSQRVRLQATINGAGFKFIKDHTESVTTLSLVLHSLESRTITVIFSPSSKGAAVAKLMFLPIESDVIHSKRQMISLYGYGGHSNVDVQKVAKDTTGKMWLSFGRLDYRGTLQQSFLLRNTGSLAAFACLNVGCKVLYPFMDSSVKISPTEVVIAPNKEVEICVSFTPRQEDFKYIHTSTGVEVSEIASIHVLSGPEPTRGRIRRLFNKMSQQGTLPQMTNEFLIPRLSGTFLQEHMPLDLLNCKESTGAMKDLLQDLVTREIALTVEHDPEKSGLASVFGADESCMFHSLCSETAQMTLDASYGQFDVQNVRRASGGFCTVEPTRLMLTPPMKVEDTVLVSSRHSRPMPFEVSIPDSGLQVTPSVGVVPPGETTVLTISCSKTQPKPLQFFKVMIYVENEVMDIEVKIHFVQPRRS